MRGDPYKWISRMIGLKLSLVGRPIYESRATYRLYMIASPLSFSDADHQRASAVRTQFVTGL